MVPVVAPRYQTARREEKSRILDEFCATTGYHRKYAIHLLNSAPEEVSQFKGRRRGYTYSAEAVRVLAAMWEAADYPWSVRLKAMIPLWLPWARNHIKGLTPELEYGCWR
jgi:hypothetical protein